MDRKKKRYEISSQSPHSKRWDEQERQWQSKFTGIASQGQWGYKLIKAKPKKKGLARLKFW